LRDIYIKPASIGVSGDALPFTGNREWWIVGDLVLPATNTALTVS
jgi:hypothetical protein